jgi:hypothetical protein
MTEQEFIRLNDELRKSQAAIRKARERSEPVHISEVLPEVMENIEQCIMQQRGTAV